MQHNLKPQQLAKLLEPANWPDDVQQMLKPLNRDQKLAISELLGVAIVEDGNEADANDIENKNKGDIPAENTPLGQSVLNTAIASLYGRHSLQDGAPLSASGTEGSE